MATLRATLALAAGAPGHNWYSFDVNGWHIVVLNSYCATNGNCEAERLWLAADLATNTSKCTMAAWHEPRYSSGYRHGSQTGIDWAWDMLVNDGAELTLVGHEHEYERFAPTGTSDNVTPDGMVEIVVGTGGKASRPPGARSCQIVWCAIAAPTACFNSS